MLRAVPVDVTPLDGGLPRHGGSEGRVAIHGNPTLCEYLGDHTPVSKWLITMVSKSPK